MVSKQAGELITKLNSLKAAQNNQGKKLKTIAKNIIEYQSKIKKWLLQFDLKISEVETELKTLRQDQLKQQEEKVREIDHFQKSLKNLLESYSKEAKNANEKLNSMVQSIKEQMRSQYKQSIQKEKVSVQRLRNMNTKLEKLIDLVRFQQKKSIDDHQKLRELLRTKSNQIYQDRQSFLQESSQRNRQLLENLNSLQSKIQAQLSKFTGKLDKKVFETTKVINYLVQQVTNS